jgi:hypothetical protein
LQHQWNPADDSLLQAAQDLTTRASRRPALLLHCAKMRAAGLRRHFILSSGIAAKF